MRELIIDLATGRHDFYVDGQHVGSMSAEQRAQLTSGDPFQMVLWMREQQRAAKSESDE